METGKSRDGDARRAYLLHVRLPTGAGEGRRRAVAQHALEAPPPRAVRLTHRRIRLLLVIGIVCVATPFNVTTLPQIATASWTWHRWEKKA